MRSMVIICYKPKKGHEEALLALIDAHFERMLEKHLITRRKPVVMRGKSGVVVAVFEWASAKAIAIAHTDPSSVEVWKRFEEVCTFETPMNVPEFQNLFASFESL
jgi:hypothetical protein